MKRKLFIPLICLLFCFVTIARSQEVTYDQTENKNGKVYLKGKEVPYTGKINGFYEDEITKKFVGFYKDGLLEGFYEEWYRNGNLKNKAAYKRGKVEGVSVSYFENGYKERETKIMGGKKMFLNTWYSTGFTKSVAIYDKEGREHGAFKYWYENRKVESEEPYEHGIKVKEHKFYSEEGELEYMEIYKKGKADKCFEWVKRSKREVDCE